MVYGKLYSVVPWAGNSFDIHSIEYLWDERKDKVHQVPITSKTTNKMTNASLIPFTKNIKLCESSTWEILLVHSLFPAKNGQTK